MASFRTSSAAFREIKDLLILSTPIIISQVGYILMGFSDNVIVGKVSSAALAAAGVSNSLFFLAAVIGIGGLSIVAPMVSKAKEEGEVVLCGKYLKAGMYVATGYSLLISLLIVMAVVFFPYFNQSAEVSVLAEQYLLLSCLSVPPLLLFIAVKQFADGLSATMAGMYASIGGLIVNILLCFVFVFGMFGIPAMGLNGAALATALTRWLMLFGLFLYVKRSQKFKEEIKGFLSSFAEIRTTCEQVFRSGISTGLQMLAESSAFSLAAVMVGWLGTAPLAAHQIVLSWAALSYMIVSGMSVAVSIRVGAGLGARDKPRIMRAVYTGMGLVVGYELLTFAAFVGGRYDLAALFTNDTDVMTVAPVLMVLMGLFQLPDGVQALWLGALRGLHDVHVPTYMVLFSYLAVCLPVAYLLAFYFGGNAAGVWLGLVIGLCLSAVLLSFRFFWYTKRLVFTEQTAL